MKRQSSVVFLLPDINLTNFALVGGKAANLGEICNIRGIQAPEGFCVSTEAYKEIVENNPVFRSLLDELSILNADNVNDLSKINAKIRRLIEDIPIPQTIADEIIHYLKLLGEEDAYAIRSSATAEDLPTASFAGQQDTFLNIIGTEAILKHISKCWASLFTDRSVIYRIQNGFDHRKVYLSVIIQKMIFPETSGVLFTADPMTSNRKTLSIDAGFGLGEALVSGVVNADNYIVSEGKIVEKKITNKNLGIFALSGGGTKHREIGFEQQNTQVISDKQILALEKIGRKIESHFGKPQDIEWCIEKEKIFIVQSRPITTLFPIPSCRDNEKHVYISTGHQQMMTDAMKPLGISVWQLRALRPFHEAANRLFVDVSDQLKIEQGAKAFLRAMGDHDPLIKDALLTVVKKGFISDEGQSFDLTEHKNTRSVQMPEIKDPGIVKKLVLDGQRGISDLAEKIATKTGGELFDFIKNDCQSKAKSNVSNPEVLGAIYTAINTALWINNKIEEWLGEKNVADILAQSVQDNITSEMGFDLLNVADVIRPYHELVEYLEKCNKSNFLEKIDEIKGGLEAKKAIEGYLDTYGMRCVGEIDITRDRWIEKPQALIPLILNNIRGFQSGEAQRRFNTGKNAALNKEKEILERLSKLPEGDQKIKNTKLMIQQLRDFAGFREYPKYEMMNHFFIYKKALIAEADKLVENNVLQFREDVYYLTFDEFKKAVCDNSVNYQIINQRKRGFRYHEKLNPPRVITSDGEIITGQYHREGLPENSLLGLPVSGGIVEGRARVIKSIADANLQEGDILVTPFTDPSWTPLFLSIKGLVTEVGGLMTHGAVIAREYGLPAIVGVENATKLINDGQKIRIDGTHGYIELL